MGPTCNSILSTCLTTGTGAPSSWTTCPQWPCQPGQACVTSSGCNGTCVFTPPSGSQSTPPVECVAPPSSQACGSTCCGPDQICSNETCKPRCGGAPYDPATQCCESQEVLSKLQIADLSKCPHRTARPGWDPNDPSNLNACGPSGSKLPVPDSYGAADFRPGCNAHDACYGTCNNNKLICDTGMHSALEASCKSAYSNSSMAIQRSRCLKVAAVYAVSVIAGGGTAYDNAQKAACICCP
ncbi:hypothetical protein [Corallococcus carmarthensis]